MLATLSSLSVEQWLFYPLAAVVAVSALGVVVAKSPLHGALMLVVSFFFLSAIYLLLGAHLVGILQVIVYAGAIMVLFLFVIMLLALGDADLRPGRFSPFKAVGALFALGLVGLLGLRVFGLLPGGAGLGLGLRPLPPAFGTVAEVGRALLQNSVLQFEAVSLLLLVGIVGAVVVAKGAHLMDSTLTAAAGAVPTEHYLALGALLFAIGMVGVLTRRNALSVFMSIELLLNAANLTFLAFARARADLAGHVTAILVMAVAAAEAAIGLAIVIAVFRSRGTLNVDEIRAMKL